VCGLGLFGIQETGKNPNLFLAGQLIFFIDGNNILLVKILDFSQFLSSFFT